MPGPLNPSPSGTRNRPTANRRFTHRIGVHGRGGFAGEACLAPTVMRLWRRVW